ncbi:hypothetical protein NCAS_0B04220 [Naumovozyma castellii]|uniref:Uncharacterized protein n=1 Tax=Naumovozyma castellii TaxID=27288 RepID=G0VA17_NAUCA|nr:hypothetical protein NCAS_0B04220 [Naumovozyma castellii CBS 4309]CCC68506.1 hypothetical protein NCAS_0B04220 [Naumovozyma castellii CBS 4309]
MESSFVPQAPVASTTTNNNTNVPGVTTPGIIQTQDTTNLPVPPPVEATAEEQRQYKIQLLLHINSVLLLRVIHMSNAATTNGNNNPKYPEQLQAFISHYLKRVHANLQCISQINQGVTKTRPLIFDAPPTTGPPQAQQQDILLKLYLLMNRVFEIW